MNAAAETCTGKSGWLGRLELGYEHNEGRTVLARNRHRGPLVLQRPLYPEGDAVCHSCILHPPGGVVGGDRLEIDVELKADSCACITTPGATKFYRSKGPLAVQKQQLRVADGACLEWLPQDAIIFPGARARLETRIDLDPLALFMGWEIICLGLPVNGERFVSGTFQSRINLYRAGRLLFRDQLPVKSEQDLRRPSGLRNYPVTATFLVSSATEELLDIIREIPATEEDALTAATLLRHDLIVIRYLGYSTFAAQGYFAKIWSRLRPEILRRTACTPRIWAT